MLLKASKAAKIDKQASKLVFYAQSTGTVVSGQAKFDKHTTTTTTTTTRTTSSAQSAFKGTDSVLLGQAPQQALEGTEGH